MIHVGLGLAGCAPGQLERVLGRGAQGGYPGPTQVMDAQFVYPTHADDGPHDLSSYFATPSPEEIVGVGEITETPPEASTSTYLIIDNARAEAGAMYALYLANTLSGARTRFGNDSGSAIFGALSDEYMLWYFLCNLCDDFRQGLYASTLDGETVAFVGERIETTQGSVKISDEWVVHLYIANPRVYISQLFAYNLKTGESLLLAEDAYWNTGNSPYYAVNEGKVAWLRAGKTLQDLSLNVYDLENHTSTELPFPVGGPRHLNVGRGVLVWWDKFWQGYDLEREALFTIPILPPGWENVGIQQDGPVTVRGHELFWPLKVNDQYYYFIAPVVPAAEKPEAVAPLPTPIGAPTRLPLLLVTTATPTSPPAAYP